MNAYYDKIVPRRRAVSKFPIIFSFDVVWSSIISRNLPSQSKRQKRTSFGDPEWWLEEYCWKVGPNLIHNYAYPSVDREYRTKGQSGQKIDVLLRD